MGKEPRFKPTTKISRLAYAQANSKNTGGDRGPNSSYWEIGYTEDGDKRFRNSGAEAEYLEYVNYVGGDKDLDDALREDKKVQGNNSGPGKYDVGKRNTLELQKDEHKKLRKRGPDRQDRHYKPDEWASSREKARAERDEAVAQQAIEEGGDVVIPEEEEYGYDRAIPREVKNGEWNEDVQNYLEERAEWERERDDPATSLNRREELEELIRANDEEEEARLAKDRKDIEEVRLQGVQYREMANRTRPSNEKGKVRATRSFGS